MVVQNDLKESFLGNRLGRYLEAVACCDLLGIHYVNIGVKEENTFLEALPSVFVHKVPESNFTKATGAVSKFCRRLIAYPWGVQGAWSSRVAALRQIVAHAIDVSHPHVANHSISWTSFSAIRTGPNITLFEEEMAPGEIQEEDSDLKLPLIPDVALMFRCVDVLTFDTSAAYGFLNFDVYSNLVPVDAKMIYVFSEALHYYHGTTQNSSRAEICINISLSLVEHLAERFPTATVALRRGHAMEHFIVLQKARTVVCTPTSFCYFAVLAGSNDVYFQESRLVSWRPFLRDNFNYIVSPRMNNFGKTLTNETSPDDPKALPEILQRLRAPVALEQIQLETCTPV